MGSIVCMPKDDVILQMATSENDQANQITPRIDHGKVQNFSYHETVNILNILAQVDEGRSLPKSQPSFRFIEKHILLKQAEPTAISTCNNESLTSTFQSINLQSSLSINILDKRSMSAVDCHSAFQQGDIVDRSLCHKLKATDLSSGSIRTVKT